MPPQILRVSVVLCWLGVMGWFFVRDFRPRIRSDEAPLYVVTATDEVKRKLPPRWRATRYVDGIEQHFLVFTRIRYHEKEDEFSYQFWLRESRDPDLPRGEWIELSWITTNYRFTREGRMQSFFVRTFQRARIFDALQQNFETTIRGRAVGATMQMDWRRHWLAPPRGEWRPIATSYPRRVFVPLHPYAYVRGVRPGQRWREPMIDVLSDAPFLDLENGPPIRWLDAEVLPERESIEWQDATLPCLKLEYRDGSTTIATLHIEEGPEGRVLRYELTLPKETWIIDRSK